MMPHRGALGPGSATGRWRVKSILGFWLFYALTVVARASSGPIRGRCSRTSCVIDRHRHRPDRAHLPGDRRLRPKGNHSPQGRDRRRPASLVASLIMGATPDPDRRLSAREQRGDSASRRAKACLIEKGNQIRIERNAGEPLVMTLPKVARARCQQAYPLRARRRGHLAVLLPRLERLLSCQPGAGRGARRRAPAAEAESAAQAAQVRALRYQVNPHFLFNTLNSLSSLVMAGRAEGGGIDGAGALDLLPHEPVARSRAQTSAWPRRSRCSGCIWTSRRSVSPPAEGRDRRSRGARKGAASRPDPAADRRECDQVWRLDEPQGRSHPDRGPRARRPRMVRRGQQPAEARRQGRASGGHTKAPASASPTSASGSMRGSASSPIAAIGPMTEGGYQVSLTMPLEANG